MTNDAYRDPNAGLIETLRQENDNLRRNNTSLRADKTKARAEIARTAMGYAFALACIAGSVLGVGATARTCAYGVDGRHNAEREATEYHRRSHGSAPFAVLCAAESDQSDYDYTCLVYRVVADPSPIVIRCDSDPAKWNDGCRGARRAP